MYDRIHVLGCPGTGKTTLARFMGERLDLPVVDLDDVYHGPGWKQPDLDDFRARVKELAGLPRFVISGNYSSAWDVRIRPTDLVIMLDLPASLCVRRIIQRSLKIRFGRRIDLLPEQCRPGPDHEPLKDYPAFLRFTWDCPARRPARLEHLARLGVEQLIDLRGTGAITAFEAAVHSQGEAALGDWLTDLSSAG